MSPVVVGAAAWAAGRWIEGAAGLDLARGSVLVRAEIDRQAFPSAPRLARADRFTRLVAMVAARALHALPDGSTAESRSVIVASTLASAHTNEAFERRRVRTGKPVPRDFSYTAPNAAAGELAAAIEARGPSVALVGGMEVGLAAIERAIRWLGAHECDRAIVVAAECPPDASAIVAPPGVAPIECAAAIVLDREPLDGVAPLTLEASWGAGSGRHATPWSALLSVELPARLVVAWIARIGATVPCDLPNGASIAVTLSKDPGSVDRREPSAWM